MKFLLLSFFIMVSFAIGQDWEVVQKGEMVYYPNSGHFINETTGIYVGQDGAVVKTEDGGDSFTILREADVSGDDWTDFQFANADTGFACSKDGFVYKTVDGGVSWTMVGDTANYTVDFDYIAVIDNKIVYVAGDDSTLLKTIDGGDNWTRVDFAFDGEDLDGGLAFLNADSGVVTVDNKKNPASWYTHDGGDTWTKVLLEFPEVLASKRIYDAAAGGDNTIAIVGYHYCIFVSHDAGMTYTVAPDFNFAYVRFTSVDVVDDNTIITGGTKGHIIKTVDGGSSWDTLAVGSGQTVSFIDYVNTSTGYVFSGNGQWFKTIDGGTSFSPLLDWPNISLWGLALPADDKIALTAWGGGEITISEDGGDNWSSPQNISTGIPENLYECEFSSTDTGLVAGSYGSLAKTTDGGLTYSFIENPLWEGTNLHFNSLRYVNNDFVLAGGSKCNMIKSLDGGDTWAEVEVEGSKTIYDICAINENQVIASGSSGYILLSNSAVDTFTLAKDYGSMAMRAVEFRGDIGLVVSSSGHIFRTTVADWDTLIDVFEEVDGDDFYDVEFVTDSLVYVVGEHGKIYKSTDAGQTWAQETSPTEETIHKVRYRNEKLWAVAADGVVLKLDISEPQAISQESNTVVREYSLKQNYPNPFNPTTTIEFSLMKSGKVELTVFNSAGQKVATLINKNMKAGNSQIAWDASHLASGLYYYRLVSGDFKSVKKMLLIK